MSTVTIYHNPACGTSRNTLGMIRNSGVEPDVVEYLKTPPSREKLKALIAAMGISVRDLLRKKGTPFEQLQLDDPKWSDEQLLDFMLDHPILINRPIVETSKRRNVDGNTALPTVGSSSGHSSKPAARSVHQGGRRDRRRRERP